MIQNLRCEGCLERGGGRRSDSSQPSPIRDKGTCRGPFAARGRGARSRSRRYVRIVSTVSFVLAMSIRPRAPHGRVGSRRPATRHSTPHTGHGGPSPSAVRPGGVASFALRGLPVPPSLAFAVYTLGIRIHYSGLGFNWFNILCRSVIPRNGTDDHRWYPEPRIRGRLI